MLVNWIHKNPAHLFSTQVDITAAHPVSVVKTANARKASIVNTGSTWPRLQVAIPEWAESVPKEVTARRVRFFRWSVTLAPTPVAHVRNNPLSVSLASSLL